MLWQYGGPGTHVDSDVPSRGERWQARCSPTPGRATAREVHENLAVAIDAGFLAEGQALVPETVAQEFGVSLPAAREAIGQLHACGLVRVAVNGRWVVATAAYRSLSCRLEVLVELECLAARLAARRITPSQAASLRGATAEPRPTDPADGSADTDRRFHELIHVGSGNPVLGQRIMQLREQLPPALRWCRSETPKARAAAHADHARILSAVLGGQAEAAADAMRAHLLIEASLAGANTRFAASEPAPVSRGPA